MKVEIEFDEVLDSWKREITTVSTWNGPASCETSAMVNAICDVSANYYQAASILIDGAFDNLPEKDVADVLFEHGYIKEIKE